MYFCESEREREKGLENENVLVTMMVYAPIQTYLRLDTRHSNANEKLKKISLK